MRQMQKLIWKISYVVSDPFKTTKIAKTMEEAPRRPDQDKRSFWETVLLKGFINKKVVNGRATKVSHKKIRIADSKMVGIWDGKDRSPSRKKIRI